MPRTALELAKQIRDKVCENWVEPDTSPGPGLGGVEWITCFHCGAQQAHSTSPDQPPFPHKKDCLVGMVNKLVAWLD